MKIVINTGFSAQLNREEALHIGISEYLQKPVSIRQMLTTLNKLLG